MYARAEENKEESPEPSAEAFFTTSSSLTSHTPEFRKNTVSQKRTRSGEEGHIHQSGFGLVLL